MIYFLDSNKLSSFMSVNSINLESATVSNKLNSTSFTSSTVSNGLKYLVNIIIIQKNPANIE